jgi:cbb3-type cytochrome oxidase subunit 1
MGATGDFRLKGVHAHLNLLGWVSMAVTAFVYRMFPAACDSLGAKLHFWLYNTALPVMGISLGGLLLGDPRFEPLVGASSIAMLVAIVTFAVTIFRHSSSAVAQPA